MFYDGVLKVVGCIIVSQISNCHVAKNVSITFDLLYHYVVSQLVEKSIIESSVFTIGKIVGMALSDLLLSNFELYGIDGSVALSITKNVDCATDEIFYNIQLDMALLSASCCIKPGTHTFNLFSKLCFEVV